MICATGNGITLEYFRNTEPLPQQGKKGPILKSIQLQINYMLYLQSVVLFTDIHAFIVFSSLFKRQPTSSFCSPTIIFFTSRKSLKKAETLQNMCAVMLNFLMEAVTELLYWPLSQGKKDW